MSTSSTISLKLNFNQVLEVVKQLPVNQQKKLIAELKDNSHESGKEKKLSEKEVKFLEGLEESVDFVNNYKIGDTQVLSLKQLLDEL